MKICDQSIADDYNTTKIKVLRNTNLVDFRPFASNKSLASQLTFARKKILTNTIPFQLRAISYLRITCSVIQKFYCLESENHSIEPQKTPYLSLLKSLSEYKVEWWSDCEISESGILRSNVAVIERLLQPLTQLHQQYLSLTI